LAWGFFFGALDVTAFLEGLEVAFLARALGAAAGAAGTGLTWLAGITD
jgi:hypothetical protein